MYFTQVIREGYLHVRQIAFCSCIENEHPFKHIYSLPLARRPKDVLLVTTMVTGYNEFPYVISLSPIMANIIVGKGWSP